LGRRIRNSSSINLAVIGDVSYRGSSPKIAFWEGRLNGIVSLRRRRSDQKDDAAVENDWDWLGGGWKSKFKD